MITKIKYSVKLGSNTSKERRKLIAQNDMLVSLIVRKRDRRSVTSGSMENLTCSHLFRRGLSGVRFDLDNCNCQALTENQSHDIDPGPYTDWFIRTKGIEKYNELKARSVQLKKWSLEELRNLKEKLKQIYSQLT